MKIAHRHIGADHPPYVIAEIGVNHDGSPQRALELTTTAARAGADAVKLQLFRTDLLMSSAAKLAAYQAAAGETDPIAMLRRLELSVDQMAQVVDRAHNLGIQAIVTVFSTELVPEAARLDWDAYKSASPDIINRPLLEAMAATGRPLIVSTGASTLDEVRRAVGWLRSARDRLALLQCVSSYPVPKGQEGLGGIAALREAFPGIPIGYSDHTDALDTPKRAVACGASLLEKHLTHDKAAPGPDHAASATGAELAEYVRSASLGRADPPAAPSPQAAKLVLECERDVRHVSRQSLVTRRAIATGEIIRIGDLAIKRPGTGIEPWRLGEVVGRPAARALEPDAPILDTDLT